jgi:Tfp pilus assembly pilus retraction ATPase PilT
MMTLEQSLANLVLQGIVRLEDALAEANQPEYLEELVREGRQREAAS